MIEKKTGKGMKAKLLIAFLTVALVFTMMPLTMGNAYADDDPAVTGDQIAVENEAAETDETSEDAIADEASEDIIVDETEGLAIEPEVEAQSTETDVVTAQEETASILIKGNVLKQEKVISAADFSSIMKENVKFDGINKSGRRGAVTVEEGDTPEVLQRRVMEQAEWLILPVAVAKICRGIVKERNGHL